MSTATTPTVELPLKAPGADRVEELLTRIVNALDKVEAKAKPAGAALDDVSKPDRLKQLAALGNNLLGAANHALELGEKALGAAQHIAELASEADRSNRALSAMGPVAAQVEAATNGVVTATQAYNVQQALVRSGLRVTNDELVTLVRGTREHAQVLGIDTAEALDKLRDSIRNGDAGGLRELGIAVRDSSTRAGNLENALRTLGREQRNAAVPARSLGEDTTRFGRSMTEAGGAVAALIAQGSGLQSFLAGAADGFGRLTREILDYVDAESRRPEQQAAQERRLRSIEGYAAAVRELRQEANRLGVQIPQFAGADQMSAESRDALTTRIRGLLGTMRTQDTNQVRTDQGRMVARSRVVRVGADGRQVFDQAPETTDRDWAVTARMMGRPGADGPLQLVNATDADSRRGLLESFGMDIQDQSVDASRDENRRREEAARRAREAAARGQGPRDTAGVGIGETNAAGLRAAQLELGLANQSLALLGVRFERLGSIMTREDQLNRLREEANRTAREQTESEDQRVQRVAAARNALVAALQEERDRREQLRTMTQADAANDATQAQAALAAARSGARLTAESQRQLDQFSQTADRLRAVVDYQRVQVTGLQIQLLNANLPLAEQLRIRSQIVTVQQTLTTNEQTLVAMGERERENGRARLELVQQEFEAWGSLYQAAREARDQGIRLTESERTAMGERANSLRRLTELERGYRELVSQATQEVAAARTEEQRNAALVRRVQLLQRLSTIEGQRRGLEREDSRSNFAEQTAARFNAALDSQATQAERFSNIASGAYSSFSDAFSTAMVAVMKGEASFGEAMRGILQSLLESISKQSIVEALRNVALGIGNLASQNYPAAGLNFAAAAAWGAVGVATGLGAAAVAAAAPPASATAAPTTDRPATAATAASAGGTGGGGLTLNIRVDGALMNEGVENSVIRAVDRAGIRNVYPRGLQRVGR